MKIAHLSVPAALLLACAGASPTTAGPTTAPAGLPTAATMPTTGPAAAIDWATAGQHVGETVTVTGPVMGTHVAGENVVLNVGKDFPAKDRFTVMMPFDAAKGEADDQFKGKTVTVTGQVKLYKKIPEIVAKAAGDVTLK